MRVMDPLRSQLLMMSVLTTVEFACSSLQQEEAQRSVLSTQQQPLESSAMLSKGRNEVDVCSACGVKGHTNERCWTVIGYPKWHPKHRPLHKGRGGGFGSSTNSYQSYSNWGRNRRYTPNKTAANVHGENEAHGITVQQLEQILKNLHGGSNGGKSTHTESKVDDEFDSGFAGFTGMVTCHNVHVEKMEWIIDSGASDHMGCEINMSKNIVNVNVNRELKINMPNGKTSNITAYGSVDLKNGIHLGEVLIVPEFKHNLLSVSKLAKHERCNVHFYNEYCVIQDKFSKEVRGVGECKNGLYYLIDENITVAIERLRTALKKTSHNESQFSVFQSGRVENGVVQQQKMLSETTLWHHRLGHAPLKKLKQIGCVAQDSKEDTCLICPMGKMTKSPYPTSKSHASYAFELLRIDIWGPYRVETRGKHRFFLTVIDDHTRTTWVSLLRHKSEAFPALTNFVKMAHTQFGSKVKIVRSDNALEFQDY